MLRLDRANLQTNNTELMIRLDNIWTYMKQLMNGQIENKDDGQVVMLYGVVLMCFVLFYREEIRELQTNLEYLRNKFSQSQFPSSNFKGTCETKY